MAFKTEDDISVGCKHHLNLSCLAYDVIHNDMFAFGEESLSGFINTIFDHYHPDADASIARRLRIEKDNLQNLLSKFSDDKLVGQIIRRILAKKEDALTQKVKSYEKGKGFKFWLSQKNLEFLSGSPTECNEDTQYPSRGKYIKCVIEEYARLPYIDREKIYYLPTIKKIENAIEEKCQLCVVTDLDKAYSVYPYGNLSDPLSTANYLVGYCKRYGYDTDEKRPCSFRISAIKSIKIEKSKGAFINKDDRKKITELIASRGVQFLVGQDAEIVVRLTDAGIRKYQRQVYLRPMLAEKRDDNIFVFQCTTAQAEFYFLKFGPDAEIISPPQLRSKVVEMHEKALNTYSESENS